ncbi:unnamed protein product [Cuscuta europaea]|uniref:Reverse transcriptase domain-containing protein n=1 Tax=Cuscuta europaea TaxID=41803 RepID=A0A9P1DX66_CUSEU|nr:unnamed protein product [Cuscuta europaea]
MHPGKAPRPDGLNPAFLQHYWDILGDRCPQGKIPRKVNRTNLILIPKKDKPESIGDLRPIGLCNVIFKIFGKVLADGLKIILNDLVSMNQSAFVMGKSIVDNVMVAFETLHWLKRKRHGWDGYLALKLDMRKAYDRVEWKYLKIVMTARF